MRTTVRLISVLLLLFLGSVSWAQEFRLFKITFYDSCAKCCKRYSPQVGGKGLTTLGNAPVPWATGATGDPALLGRWVFFEDLGQWVYLSDTGAKCVPKKKRPCVARDQIDIFTGGPEMHKWNRRLGVKWWEGRVR